MKSRVTLPGPARNNRPQNPSPPTHKLLLLPEWSLLIINWRRWKILQCSITGALFSIGIAHSVSFVGLAITFFKKNPRKNRGITNTQDQYYFVSTRNIREILAFWWSIRDCSIRIELIAVHWPRCGILSTMSRKNKNIQKQNLPKKTNPVVEKIY